MRKTGTRNRSYAVLMLWFFLFLAPGLCAQEEAPADMVFVEGGLFAMGDTFGGGSPDEKPIRNVTVSSFYIGKYEVTQKEFMELMGFNPSQNKGDTLPVERVTWYDAIAFCNARSLREGLNPVYTLNGTRKTAQGTITYASVSVDWEADGYRLPTEAEWEFAAKGGTKSNGFKYAGGNDPDRFAWYENNSGKKTQSVGLKEANELGLHDMSGNVWEWCWDWSSGYSPGAESDPKGPATGSARVLRGGSWYNAQHLIRASIRIRSVPGDWSNTVGFRIAASKK